MVLSGWRARVVARSPPNTVQHTTFISHHFPLSNIPFHPQDQGKGSTVPLGWGWEGILGVFRAGLRAESKFLSFQNLGIIGDNLMCSSLLPAQLCREHCFWWLVVNVLVGLLCGVPSLLFPSLPHLHPLQTPHRGKTSVMARKNSAEAETQLFCLPKTGVRGRALWTFLLFQPHKTKAAKYTACPVFTAQGSKPPKGGLKNVSLALFWPLVALACPHTPALPCCDCWSFYPWMHSSQLRLCTLGVWLQHCAHSWKTVHNCTYFSCKTFWVCWYFCRSVDVLLLSGMSLQGPHVVWDLG